MPPHSPASRLLYVPFGLLTLAALTRFWIAPELVRLPSGYASETRYDAVDRFRESPAGEWQDSTLTARRVDLAITTSGDVAIVEGDLFWMGASGQVIFESSGLYGVNRRTRANALGYGDAERSGQFLFPPHTPRATIIYWDPQFIGPRTATFDHQDTLEGLSVYIFRFSAQGMDESAGYSFLPDVPERYHAHTDGQGMLWIEPISGFTVDYQEQGVSYYADPASGERLADFHQWSGRYTPETRAAQLRLARAARLRLLALEAWLPAGLVALALLWLVRAGLRRR